MRKHRIASPHRAAAALAIALLAACGGAGDKAPTAATPERADAELAVGDPIPAAGKDAVLDMSGTVGVTNEGNKLTLDVETLEQMPMTEATVYEPFLEMDKTFEGVLLSDLFRYAEVGSAREVEMTALDEYHVIFPMEEIQQDKALLATRVGGQAIELADGGPVRLVFLDSETHYKPLTDYWIWSVRSMDFSG